LHSIVEIGRKRWLQTASERPKISSKENLRHAASSRKCFGEEVSIPQDEREREREKGIFHSPTWETWDGCRERGEEATVCALNI
jgi:hypothetical protein